METEIISNLNYLAKGGNIGDICIVEEFFLTRLV